MKKESEPQNQVDAAGPNPAPNDRSTSEKITNPSSPRYPTIQFQEIQVGQFFEFRGRRYEKLALSMASDEERNGNICQAQTEVLPDPLAQLGSTSKAAVSTRPQRNEAENPKLPPRTASLPLA